MIQRNIPSRVIQVIVDRTFVDPDEVNLLSHIKDDLGADSLDMLEITLALEDEFNITIPDNVYEKITTVQSAITCVEERAGGK